MRLALSLLAFTTTMLFSISPLKATFFNNILACVKSHHHRPLTLTPSFAPVSRMKGHKCSIIHLKNEPPFQIRTIVVDAGHGGHDPGCLGAGSQEKHLALAIAKAFANRVRTQYPDIQVILTRDEDVFIPLYERAAIANRANADLFISIHCNAMPPGNSGTAGTETYVMGLHTAEHNLDVAKRENSAILLEDDYERNYDYDPNSPEGHILLSMFQNAFLEQSILFAERVEHHFHATAERRSRGVKQAGFVVLKETAMPSVLVEAGFLTNRKDEVFLKSEEGQELVATSLLNAFIEYKSTLEGVSAPELAVPNTMISSSPAVVERSPSPTPSNNQPSIPNPQPQEAYQSPQVPNTPPPTYNSPPVQTYNPPQVPGRPVAVKAEPVIQTNPVQGTISSSVPAQERALQPKGKGDTSWAESIGREDIGSSTVEGLIYCVQLAASPRPFNTRISPWNTSTFLIEVVQEDELYKYQVRNFAQFGAASQARYQAQSQGFPDAFVVAYLNGQRISLDVARNMSNTQN